MPETIDFLERMGEDARLRHASRDELESELVRIGINADARTALLNDDNTQLTALLGANANTCCVLQLPDSEWGDQF